MIVEFMWIIESYGMLWCSSLPLQEILGIHLDLAFHIPGILCPDGMSQQNKSQSSEIVQQVDFRAATVSRIWYQAITNIERGKHSMGTMDTHNIW